MAVVHQLDSVDIAEVTVDEEELCGFCFQGYVGMEDPRQMPCGHVYCLGCLEVHTENIEGVDCAYSYCSGFCLHKKVPALPMVVVIDTPEPQPVTTSVCECRGCGNQIATNYCVDCGKKLCSFHNEHHPAFFDEHHVVPITTYEDAPQDFKKPLCEEHSKPLQLACEVCHELVCVECDLMAKTCEGGKSHTMKGMEVFEAKLNKRYTELLNKAPVEVAKLCKLEKELWTKHDDVLSHNEMMIRDVDKQTEKQIKAIQGEAEKIKNSIMREQQSMTAKVIADTTDLMGKREKIDLLQRSMCQLRDRGHVTEKIRWMQKSTLDMEELSITNLVHTIPSIVTAPISTGKLSQLEMQLAQLPSELQFKKQYVKDFLSRSAICVKGKDEIVIIFDNTEITLGPQFEVKAQHSLPLKYSQPNDSLCVVLAQNDGVMYKLEAGVLSECRQSGSRISLPARSDLLSICTKFVVSAKKSDTQIHLTPTAQDKTEFPSSFMRKFTASLFPNRIDSTSQTLDNLKIHNIVLQNDETLLAVGQDEQKIAKLNRYFVIEGKRVELDWSCDLPDLCQSLAVDEYGVIYTAGVHSRKVYIVSSQGYILKEIMNDNLPMDISYMAVRGKWLVVAGGTSLQLYKILGC